MISSYGGILAMISSHILNYKNIELKHKNKFTDFKIMFETTSQNFDFHSLW